MLQTRFNRLFDCLEAVTFHPKGWPAGLETCGSPLTCPPWDGAVVCHLANMGGIIPNFKQKSSFFWTPH